MRVTAGRYAGAVGKIVRLLPSHGEHGFAEVEMKFPDSRKTFTDLLPCHYLSYPGDHGLDRVGGMG
ncbi:hypothetical protein AB3X94_01035 [Paraburkholderia sp. BR10923]|uniref:hypothetical protein n=1 Tax=Paraburkholderia sp. BR10923 TaxID=3236992 RepID=UPI0034CDD5F4